MVTCKLYGRLGNQLFQIATSLAYSLDNGVPYLHNRSTENPSSFPNYFFKTFYGRNMLKDKNYFFGWPSYREPSHGYNKIPAHMRVILDGYFQSYKYFDHHRSFIREFLNPEWEPLPGHCSIHIRRGDYLLYPTKHPVITKRYLDMAIEFIQDTYNPSIFLFFSDDPEWTNEYAKTTSVRYSVVENQEPMDDLLLMSCCQYNIIANSSFSWWAAYFNASENKTVVSPHESSWFGPDNFHLDVRDLLPPSWNTIKF